MTASQTPAHTNRLARETSPYLLQHAHNPVDWHPWGPEALQRAKREDKPILLSIGYATCHWCHVMERESFENEDIAALMNRHFVCIKVDREERPDLDEIYMTATVAMSGHGGWPMTVFLTPDQQPFFAGTYFPAEDRYGRPGFPTLLERIAELWQSDRQGLVEQASQLTRQVRAQSQAMRPAPVGAELLEQAAKQLAGEFDETHGGFGGAPKFPPSASLALLLRHHHHTGDAHALHMVRRTLDAMKGGGIYDQIGGGFARYATDAEWLVPHFEKMLYDNGLLARVYLEAFQVTEEPEYRRIAVETLDYALREMQSNEGGFFSATDADSEGEEGKFFVWSPGEIHDVIGDREQAEAVCRYFDVTDAGNWEGTNILHTPRSMEEVARELGLSAQRLQEIVAEAKPKLYAARLKRVPPLLDDKILVSWNALMIRALAEGYRSLGNEAYLQAAEQASRYILEHMRREDGGLFRTARDGRAQLDAYLEDYAFFADALIDLYEAGGSARYLGEAEKLAERMVADFADPEGGGFFFTAASHEQLIVRNREGHDGALPNANAVAARALARLSFHLDRDAFREQAEQAVRAYGRFMERAPRAFATSLGVADLLLRGPVEAALVGTHGDPAYEALRMELGRHYLPNRILAHADPSAPASVEPAPSAQPLLEGKGPVDGKPALYVCRDFACKAPVTAPGDVAAALEQTSKVAEEEKRRALSGHKLAGVAAKEGTARYAQRFEARFGRQAYGTLGELTVSGLGFGTYRADDMTPEHREALKKALSEGVNLIDTSTNYTDGHSERLVGEVIDELSGKELQRDQVVVVSKVGYVQGQNLEIAKRRESEGKPLPDMVKLGDELWHCIAPEWLQDQLGRSLDRLGLQTLDFCLLHNPEYFLAQAAQQGDGTLEAHREEFYARLKRAFEHLEGEVKAGRIGGYGVSSNTAGQPASHPEATSLARMLEAAREAGGANHHFRVLQLPLNLLEPGAALEQSEPDARSVLELAEKEHVAVLVNRPLNAIRGRRLVRLADPPELAEAPAFREQLREVAGLEREFREKIGSKLRAAEGAAVDPGDLFRWSEHLAHQPEQVDSLHQWLEIERQAIVPQLAQVFSMLDEVLANALGATWMDWRKQYEQAFQKLMQAMRSEAAKKSEAQARAVREAIDPALPQALRDARLSHKALQTLRSTAGVTTVLLGMRNPHYVEDAWEVMKQQPDLDARAVYEAAKQIELPETE